MLHSLTSMLPVQEASSLVLHSLTSMLQLHLQASILVQHSLTSMMPVQKRFGDVWRCHCMVSTAAVEFLRMPVQLLCRHPSLQAKLTHMN